MLSARRSRFQIMIHVSSCVSAAVNKPSSKKTLFLFSFCKLLQPQQRAARKGRLPQCNPLLLYVWRQISLKGHRLTLRNFCISQGHRLATRSHAAALCCFRLMVTAFRSKATGDLLLLYTPSALQLCLGRFVGRVWENERDLVQTPVKCPLMQQPPPTTTDL